MKLAGVLILYNPDNTLINNIVSYLGEIERLYIFNNSPINNIVFPAAIQSKITYFHDGENKGIAKRLNEALSLARADGYEYLLTMDQDSSFKPSDLKVYKSIIQNHPLNQKTAMYGVAHNVKELNTPVLNEGTNKLITSGSIINLSILPNDLLFDEQLFIDSVDIEFCFNAWEQQLNTILINSILLNHNMGEERMVTTPLLHKKSRMIHNPLRLYYIVRNFFYVRKKHPKYHYAFTYSIIQNEIKNGLLYGGKPFEYLKEITLAIIHAINGKMGKR